MKRLLTETEPLQDYVRLRKLPGAQVDTGEEALQRAEELAAAIVLNLARQGVGVNCSGSYYAGEALEWSRLNFQKRREAMTTAVVTLLRIRDGLLTAQPGEFLARWIHARLRPGNGLGPQVFYRSLPAPEAPAGGLPPPLPGEPRGAATSTAPRVSNLQIVLPLIDDASWRYWLAQLAAPSATPTLREFMPVALDSTAYNAPERLRESPAVHWTQRRRKRSRVPSASNSLRPCAG